MQNPQNILVRMPNWLGDLVMATPILQNVKEAYPQAKIEAMCLKPLAPLLEESPYVDSFFPFVRPSSWWRGEEQHALLSALREKHFDVAILLTNSFSSAWWAYRAKIPYRLGFAGNLRSPLLHAAPPFPSKRKQQHLVITYQQLLQPFGIDRVDTKPRLFVSEEERAAVQQLLHQKGVEEGDVVIGVHPCAAYGTAKRWLPERFREVVQRLQEFSRVHIVFVGDGKGKKLIDDITQGLSPRVLNLAGKTSIRELVAWIDCFDLFLTNDSGPMHIAAACNTPLVALFGSTCDTVTGPYGIGRVIHKHVECSPCFKRECPIDFRCMKQITVNEVLHEIQEALPLLRD